MILYFICLIFLFRCLEIGKKYRTVQKRRKGERKVDENNQISNKHIRCPPVFRKCGDEQQSMKSNYSYKGNQQFIRSSKPCDENSKQCDQNSEQWDDKNSGRYHGNSRQHDDENSAQHDDKSSEQCDESSEQCDENSEHKNNEQLDDENSEQCDKNNE